jgi:hypothetical protein
VPTCRACRGSPVRALFAFLIVVPLVGCGHSTASRPQPPGPTPSATATPDSRIALYDLNTFQRTYSVGVPGRIPLGLFNTLSMQFASARTEHLDFGEAIPTDTVLNLSIVLGAPLAALVATNGSIPATYQWWFYTAPQTDALTASPDHAPQLKIALRFADGAWGVYTGRDGAWTVLPDTTFHFGEYEITAKVRIDPAWGLKPGDTIFFRAVTAVDGVFVPPIKDVGDVYPQDLTWRQALAY